MEHLSRETGRIFHKHKVVDQILDSGVIPELTKLKGNKKALQGIYTKVKPSADKVRNSYATMQKAPDIRSKAEALKNFNSVRGAELDRIAPDLKAGAGILNESKAGVHRIMGGIKKVTDPVYTIK